MKYRLGIDTGGTFTDVVLFDEADQKVYVTKTPSTPSNPALAVINGIDKITRIRGINPENIDFLVHGTTVATNALLEYKGIETALLLTEGFKDILSIARQARPKLFDWFAKRPDPLVPRRSRYEISERVSSNGEIIKTLDRDQIKAIAIELRERNMRSIAVCLLHPYANRSHEREIKKVFSRYFPGAKVCLSSDVLSEIREYERMSTTVINAYVMPIIERYLEDVRKRMEKERKHIAVRTCWWSNWVHGHCSAGEGRKCCHHRYGRDKF
jgi:N-methylhydantoinase A